MVVVRCRNKRAAGRSGGGMARSDYASCYYIGCPNKVKLFKRICTNKTYETYVKFTLL
jgi:hypothetical protein